MQPFKRAVSVVKNSAVAILLAASVSCAAIASEAKPQQQKSAIVVAAFGTTYSSAVDSLIAIKDKIEQAYPGTPVKFAFTSNIIRKKWHARQADKAYQLNHPEVPQDFYQVKNILGALADLQNEGYKNIVVQTTLLSPGEEFFDMKSYIDALASITTLKEKWKPFNKIAIGRPLMGTWGNQYEYHQDLQKLVVALAEDVQLAQKNNTALVYMGHGNHHLSTGLYYQLDELMNQTYPQVKTYIGLVAGHPNFETLIQRIKADGVKDVTIKPLMVVAGEHATNDMAGDDDDAWKVMMTNEGLKVTPVLAGLGSKDAIQKIYLAHLIDAAKDADIDLK